MTRARWRLPCLGAALLALALLAPQPACAKADKDYERLVDRFNQLVTDPVLGTHARAQLDEARSALAALKDAGRREHDHYVYIAERRIEIARAVAETDVLDSQIAQLQRRHDRLQLAIARRDADQSRAELERIRLQSQIRAEEAQRAQQAAEAARAESEQATLAASDARAEAVQAKRMAAAQAKATALAKKEAELEAAVGGAPRTTGKGGPAPAPRAMGFDESAFVNGKATFAPGASGQIEKAVTFVNSAPNARVRIEVRAAGNTLARERADALRRALVAAGVRKERIDTAVSASKTGRIDIILAGRGT